jgi:hypothetical protein
VVVTGSVAVPNSGHKRRHLLGWSSDDEGSDSEEPSFNGVNKGSRGIAVPAREQTTDVVTRGTFGCSGEVGGVVQ